MSLLGEQDFHLFKEGTHYRAYQKLGSHRTQVADGTAEWSHDASLDWHLLEWEGHAGVQRWVGDLNRLYREQPALHERDCEPGGFEWIDCNDSDHSLLPARSAGAGAAKQLRSGPWGVRAR